MYVKVWFSRTKQIILFPLGVDVLTETCCEMLAQHIKQSQSARLCAAPTWHGCATDGWHQWEPEQKMTANRPLCDHVHQSLSCVAFPCSVICQLSLCDFKLAFQVDFMSKFVICYKLYRLIADFQDKKVTSWSNSWQSKWGWCDYDFIITMAKQLTAWEEEKVRTVGKQQALFCSNDWPQKPTTTSSSSLT